MSACPGNLRGVPRFAPRDAHSPEPRVRRMRITDLEKVSELENRVYDFPWSRKVFRSCFGRGYEGCVMEWSRAIIGYGIMLVVSTECHLVNLCVDSAFRERGLGRALLRLMLARAASLGARRAFLEVRPSNAAALALYLSENFSEVSLRKDYYPTPTGREDALVLAKLL